MTHEQRTALQRYAAAYRVWASAADNPPTLIESVVLRYSEAMAAGVTHECTVEIRRGVDLALALDAYREAYRALIADPVDVRADDASSTREAAIALGATPEQLAKARAEAERPRPPQPGDEGLGCAEAGRE